MNGPRRPRRSGSRGQVIVIVALAMIALLGMVALALDGSYGFLQARRAQNAADFASLAVAKRLEASCQNAQLPPSDQQVAATVRDTLDQNGSTPAWTWSGSYLDASSNRVGSIGGGSVPPGACGATVTVTPSWQPFVAGVLGYRQLTAQAGASARVGSSQGTLASVISLDKVGPHAVLGGGSGNFVVSGDMYLNTDVTRQPWTQSRNGMEYNDAVDAKDSSNLYVYGVVHTAKGTYRGQPVFPLDWCFGDAGPTPNTNPGSSGPTWVPGTNPAANPPFNRPTCTDGQPTVDYNYIDTTWSPVNDPLAAPGGLADPLDDATNAVCPGQALQHFASLPAPVNGVTLLQPGSYDFPVTLTGSTQLADCSGTLDSRGAAYSGIFLFPQGLAVTPGSNQSVTGYNVMLALGTPMGLPGNVPGSVVGGRFVPSGSGNGGPCLPRGVTNVKGTLDVDAQSPRCGGTNGLFGVIAHDDSPVRPDRAFDGTGTNFSLIAGGASGSSITLTAPLYGPYVGVALFQHRSQPANFGMDAQAGDAATITVSGLVYNASLPGYGTAAPQVFWDTGIPYYNGGTLQTGFGTGWSHGPQPSSGSVTVNGICLVDDFNTDGTGAITINGQPYSFPTGGGPAEIFR